MAVPAETPGLYVIDEAHHIKTPNAKRTKSIVASSRYAPYKRIPDRHAR